MSQFALSFACLSFAGLSLFTCLNFAGFNFACLFLFASVLLVSVLHVSDSQFCLAQFCLAQFCPSQRLDCLMMTAFLSLFSVLSRFSFQTGFPLSQYVFYVSVPETCFAYFKSLNDYFSQKRWDTKNSFAGDLSSTLQNSASSKRVCFLHLDAWNMFRVSQSVFNVSMPERCFACLIFERK